MASKYLLVEDTDQQGAVIGLMRHHVRWPREPEGWPVKIEIEKSAEEVLDFDEIDTRLQASGLRALGLILDADDKFDARWRRIKDFCRPRFKDVPADFPATGLTVADNKGRRFGAWIMPDNKSAGMIETFCKYLIPSEAASLWAHAEAAVANAKTLGAPWRPTHREKAHIHTWLAWQDPPGERMGQAITKKILDPASPNAAPFVAWFKNLYEL